MKCRLVCLDTGEVCDFDDVPYLKTGITFGFTQIFQKMSDILEQNFNYEFTHFEIAFQRETRQGEISFDFSPMDKDKVCYNPLIDFK